STVPTERLIAMGLFEKEGTYPGTKKMLSWAFESHVDELDFEVYQKALIMLPESKGDNPLVNSQELTDEQVCNALNKVAVETEARLFTWNDSIRALEGKLAKKEEELAKVARNLKQEELISAQL
ncbi:hypothetical protein KI387_038277, partial [Taxus chinensis]